MNGLSEAELHVQAMRLVCEALQDREQDGLEVDWDVIRQMHDQMDAMLQDLGHKHRYDSSEIVDLRKERDHWKQARQDAHEAGELMRAEIEMLRQELDKERSVSAGLREQLDAARAEVETLRTQLDVALASLTGQRLNAEERDREIERLQAFVSKVRAVIDNDCDGQEIDEMIKALGELDAGNEPTPVAEPLDAEGDTCPGK